MIESSMIFLLPVFLLMALGVWFKYYVSSVALGTLLVGYYSIIWALTRKILQATDVPICAMNANGYIVCSNQTFKKKFGLQKKPRLVDLIEIDTQDESLFVMDKIGRSWRLAYLHFGNKTLVLFMPTHEGRHGWLHDFPIPACVIDEEYRILSVNTQLLEYIDDNWQDYSIHKYIAKTRLRDWNKLIGQVLQEDTYGEIDVYWQGPKNQAVKLFVQKNENGGLIVFLHNMEETEYIKQQAQKAQNLQVLGYLTANVVHDFNNLLTAISGFCYLLQEHLSSDHVASKDVREIQNTTARAQEMTKQLLTLSADKPDIQFSNPVTVLRESLQTIRMLNGEKATVSMNLPDIGEKNVGKYLVRFSSAQVLQILINLVINARDANAKQVKVNLKLEKIEGAQQVKSGVLFAGEYVVLSVKDNGDGIPVSVQSKLLKAFFTTKETGSGIGLMTLSRMLSMNEGGLDFTSASGNTLFKVYMPVQKPTTEKKKQKTILLAEDDALIRDLTSRALIYNGYSVISCEHGGEAIDVIRNGEEIDILITDAIMPNVNGLELIEEVKKIDPKMPIVFMSGIRPEELKEKVPEDVVLLKKPMQIKDLVRVLDTLSN